MNVEGSILGSELDPFDGALNLGRSPGVDFAGASNRSNRELIDERTHQTPCFCGPTGGYDIDSGASGIKSFKFHSSEKKAFTASANSKRMCWQPQPATTNYADDDAYKKYGGNFNEASSGTRKEKEKIAEKILKYVRHPPAAKRMTDGARP